MIMSIVESAINMVIWFGLTGVAIVATLAAIAVIVIVRAQR